MRSFKTGQTDKGQRADVFVAKKFPEFARSALSKLFTLGMVRVNGRTAKAGNKLKVHDKVRVDDSLMNAAPASLQIPVIYEDQDVVVMDKPAGVLTHSKGALNQEATVASFVKDKITDKNLTGNRAGIVHRLDRATSGVIIAAKNSVAQKHLQKQFSTRKTKKIYLAIAEGWPEPEAAIIDAPIERNPKHPQTFRTGKTGKSAQTEYHTLKRFTKKGKTYARLTLKPTTGRTHQLRVHLRYIGHPIVGDAVYGRGGDNLLLHASSLEISLPGGERRIFKAKTPKHISRYE